MIRKTDLRELLEHGDQIIAASLVGLRKSTEPVELLCLTIEARRKRYGGEIHLVVPSSSSAPVRHPRPALIKAVARSRVFACAFLAPDIVEAILEGRQPLTLKFEHLYKNIPLSWAEQREQFGFPQNSRSAKSALQ